MPRTMCDENDVINWLQCTGHTYTRTQRTESFVCILINWLSTETTLKWAWNVVLSLSLSRCSRITFATSIAKLQSDHRKYDDDWTLDAGGGDFASSGFSFSSFEKIYFFFAFFSLSFCLSISLSLSLARSSSFCPFLFLQLIILCAIQWLFIIPSSLYSSFLLTEFVWRSACEFSVSFCELFLCRCHAVLHGTRRCRLK